VAWQRCPHLLPELCSESVAPGAWGGVPTSAQLMVSRLQCALHVLLGSSSEGHVSVLFPFSSLPVGELG
jgi:hypothetical protein